MIVFYSIKIQGQFEELFFLWVLCLVVIATFLKTKYITIAILNALAV
jgi:hypothetical protein